MKRATKTRSTTAYCGLDCAECQRTKGEIARLSKELRGKLEEYEFKKTAGVLANFMKPYANYDKCYELLGEMSGLLCEKGCRNGGGNPHCPIRTCNKTKGSEGCWACGTFETCDKLNFLKPAHGDELLADLKKLRAEAKVSGT